MADEGDPTFDPTFDPASGGETISGRVNWSDERLLYRIGRELPGFLPDVEVVIENIGSGAAKVTWRLRPGALTNEDS